jgi:ribose transport system permease protein
MAEVMRGTIRRWGSSLAIVGLVVALFAVGGVVVDGFASERSLRSILVLAAVVGVASAGQTLVVIIGGIDLSIPFLIGFANVTAAQLFGAEWPWPMVVLTTTVMTGTIGALNGWLSCRFRLHPLIVTLAVGTIAQGAVLWWTSGFPSGSVPRELTAVVSLGSATGPLPVPPIVPLWLAITTCLAVFERWTVLGRHLFALGSNPVAAELALVRPQRVWSITFGLSGILAGTTGVLLLGFTGQSSGTIGSPYLFQTIAAVVVGGTPLSGGQGTVARTALGSILLVELSTMLVGLRLPSPGLQVVFGLVLAALVAVYGRQKHTRELL